MEINDEGETSYTASLRVLAESYSPPYPLSHTTFDAYLRVARECSEELWLGLCDLAARRCPTFPSVLRLLELKRSVELDQLLARRREAEDERELLNPSPPTLRAHIADAFGVTKRDEEAWREVAARADLSPGLRRGLYVPPADGRLPALVVASTEATLAWKHVSQGQLKIVNDWLLRRHGMVGAGGLYVVAVAGLNNPRSPHAQVEARDERPREQRF